MSLVLLKELEDLKQNQGKLSSELGDKILTKKKQYIDKAFKDFENFFKEQNFQIQAKQRIITATYGNLKAELIHGDPLVPIIGAYFRFDLSLELNTKNQYMILLNPKNKLSTASSYSVRIPKDSEDEIKQEIAKLNESIEETKRRIENFDNQEWGFFLPNNSSQRSPLHGIPYESLYDLLTALIK